MPHHRPLTRVPALAVLLIAMAGCGEKLEVTILNPGDPRAPTATDAVTRFHDALAQGTYADVCRTSEPGTFSSTTGLSCTEFLKFVHDKLGNVVKSDLTGSITADRREGVPARLELEYKTQFESGEARERFGIRITGKQATLWKYTIDAEALRR